MDLPESSGSEVLEHFAPIKSGTLCVFADKARLWALRRWEPSRSALENLGTQRETLERFCTEADRQALDGIVLELPGALGATIEDLATTVGDVIAALCELDPAQGRSLDRKVDKSGWWLTFAGRELFVLAFAPCYPETHSRWSFGLDATYIIFQPRSAFERRRNGESSISSHTRARIRQTFSDMGQPYDSELADSDIEAHQFVKPLALGDPPVRWWPDPPSAGPDPEDTRNGRDQSASQLPR